MLVQCADTLERLRLNGRRCVARALLLQEIVAAGCRLHLVASCCVDEEHLHAELDVSAESVDLHRGTGQAGFVLRTPDGSAPVLLSVPGEHMVGNALAAAAGGSRHGLRFRRQEPEWEFLGYHGILWSSMESAGLMALRPIDELTRYKL